MLANGTKLGFKATSAGSSYTDIPELKTIPDLGSDPEKVENTRLNASVKNYEYGVGDTGDITYGCDYDNSSATSTYRVMRDAQKANKLMYFKETMPDGTATTFSGYVAVKLKRGALNSPVSFDLSIALQGEMEQTDPTASV